MAKKVEIPKVKTVTTDKLVTAFFKENPDATSVCIVGDQLFLGTYYGAAKEYSTRVGQKIEEFKNPNLATEATEATEEVETEGADTEN